MVKIIEYKPLEQNEYHSKGKICLSITNTNNKFNTWYGGCSVGSRDVLEDAEKLLLERALENCKYQRDKLIRQVAEYQKHIDYLTKNGLEKI